MYLIGLNMLLQVFILAISVIDPSPSFARLHETLSEAKARYGMPVNEFGIIMLPLLKGTKELRYHHHGWRIRSAYVNDRAVIICYMKLARQSTPDAVLKDDEMQAILKAESDGYKWLNVDRGTKVTNSKKYQGYFNSSSRVWKRGDGAVAWVSGNSALTVISPEGLNYEVQFQNRKEEQRKASITDF